MKVCFESAVSDPANLDFFNAVLNLCASCPTVRNLVANVANLSAHMFYHSFRWFVHAGRFVLVEQYLLDDFVEGEEVIFYCG